jgi:hypothetical protein
MTEQEIQDRLDAIKAAAADNDQYAHILEKSLWACFIESVVDVGGELGEKARLVLSTGDIDFSRRYA